MDDNVQKKTQIKGDMFESCPEVKRMRKMNRSQGVTTEQLRQQSQQMAGMNPVMAGMYGGVPNQSNQQNGSSDSGNGSSSGDEDGDE